MKKLFLTLTLVLFVIPFGISQDLPSYVPTDGLVAYYPFNGNANDESGGGYHGVVNGATLTTDRFENIEKAYSYNGKDTFISLPNDFFDGTENGTYTINFWTKNFQGGSRIFYKGGSWKDLSIDIISDNKVKYSFRNGTNTALNNLTSNTSLEQDKWYNITIRQESGEIDLYLNGTFDAQLQTNDVVDWSTSINTPCAGVGMHFGKNYNNCTVDVGYYGVIDDFGIWDRALTEEEIQNLYTSSTGDIILNGVVSAENNQIKNVADPTDAQDVITKSYFDSNTPIAPNKNIEQILSYGNDANGKQLKGLADPTDAQDAVTLSVLLNKIETLQDQIYALQATSGSGTVTDQDGNSYPYLTYGDQVWTVKNAAVVTYRDGTPIPQVIDATEWANLTTGAWCYYDNDPTKGMLYNWYAVAGIHDNDENTPNKELAPEGWHVPTNDEWTTLENYLIANDYNYDQSTTENKIAKAMASKIGWTTWTGEGAIGNDLSLNNSSGFNAVPGGSILGDVFSGYGSEARFWTSTYFGSDRLYHKRMDYRFSHIYTHNEGATLASSIRFVKDYDESSIDNDGDPVISTASISPANPTIDDDLTCLVSATDDNSDPISFSFVWYRNGLIIENENEQTLSATNTSVGDVISCQVTASDGQTESVFMTASVEIKNDVAPGFAVSDNGKTISCPNLQAGTEGIVNGKTYVVVDRQMIEDRIKQQLNLDCLCTTNIDDMSYLLSRDNYNVDIFYSYAGSLDLSSWDTSNVTNMQGIFKSNYSAIGEGLGYWDVSNVTDMSSAFRNIRTAHSFLSNTIENWDVSSVTNMSRMFDDIRFFNLDLGGWNVSSVTDMSYMFYGADQFNQDLSGWQVSNVDNCYYFYSGNYTKPKPDFINCNIN